MRRGHSTKKCGKNYQLRVSKKSAKSNSTPSTFWIQCCWDCNCVQKSAGSTQHALHAVCVVRVHCRVLHGRLTKPARFATLAAIVATTTRRQPYLFHRAPSLLRTRLFHFYTFRSPLFLFSILKQKNALVLERRAIARNAVREVAIARQSLRQ